MTDSEQSKSEAPTPFKLAQARKKGSVARGMDLAFLSSLAALLACAWFAGPRAMVDLSRWMKAALITGGGLADTPSATLAAVSALFFGMAQPVLSVAIAVFALTLLFELIQTGVVFSAHPLKPDFSRLNPAKGLKRIFSIRLLIETAKNIAKIFVYVIISALIIRALMQDEMRTIKDASSLARLTGDSVTRLLAAFVLAAFVFAVIDQLIARRQFLKTMRMSRRDIRREMRDREGDPRLRQKRKQLHGAFTKTSQSLRNLKGADILIVNPQHVAVALRYEAKAMHAPLVVSIGVNQIAQRLKRLAIFYNVPIVENPPLARALLQQADLNGFIPEACFGAVAEIYNQLRRQNRASLRDI